MKELYDVKNELSRINKEVSNLRKRRSELEGMVMKWIEMNDQPGVKYKDMAFVPQKKKTHKKLSDAQIKVRLRNAFAKAGIDNTDINIVNEFMTLAKGEENEKTVLKSINRYN